MQVFLYHRLYPTDRVRIKATVRLLCLRVFKHTYVDIREGHHCVVCSLLANERSNAEYFTVRLLDFIHTAMICSANWQYLIEHFGNSHASLRIAWYVHVTTLWTQC